jgi:hypothetical protein
VGAASTEERLPTLLRAAPLRAAVVAANEAGSEAVSLLGAVGEIDAAGLLAAGRAPGEMVPGNAARSAARRTETDR